MAQKRKAKTKSKGYTLSQFRAWLEGVEEMQESNWIPNHDQWAIIRTKINELEPDVQIKETVHVVTGQSVTDEEPQQRPVLRPSLDKGREPSAPIVPGRSSLSTLPDNRPRAPVVDESRGAPVARDERAKVQTPTIDTSNGKYTPPFA